jgi:hypothetical protein
MRENERIDLSEVVVRSQEILASQIDGDVVMMNIDHGTYSGLDSIGSEIWDMLKSPLRVSEICDVLIQRYEVGRIQCERDVLAFLNDLASDESIKVVDSAR